MPCQLDLAYFFKGTIMLKYITKYGAMSLFFCCIYASTTYAGNKISIIDFDNLGVPLNPKGLTSKERLILRKQNISEDLSSYDTEYMSNSNTVPRVFKLANVSGKLVASRFCNASMDGSSFCEISSANLTTGDVFASNEDSFTLEYDEDNGSSYSISRFLINENKELEAIIILNHNEKKFKGKKTCDNSVSLWHYDTQSRRITEVQKKQLGKECYPRDDRPDERVVRAYNELVKSK